MKKTFLTIATAAFAATTWAQTPQLRADNIDEVLQAMTLREKATLLVGELAANQNAQGTQIGNTERYIPGAAGNTYAIPRLGIPPTVMADGPAGLRIYTKRNYDSHTYYCTGFPIGTSLAAIWDADVVSKVTAAMGNEVLKYGVDVILAPGNNIHRNPLCGRNFEYLSEDPVLSGNIAAAYINGIQSNGVGTSLKHYAFNNQETRRLGTDARVSQRAAREIYLKPFEIAVKKSQPWTVMSSYNKVNGEYTNSRRDLLTDILRNEWGFQGIVVTDWGGFFDATKCIGSGNDLVQPGSPDFINQIIEAVESGKLSDKDVDTSVRRMLEYIVKTPRFNQYKFDSRPDLKAHAQLVREAAADGTVLLKNDGGVLPFKDVKNIALFGCGAYRLIAGGTGSGDVNKAYIVSLVEGLRNGGFQLDENVVSEYTEYLKKYDESMWKLEWWQRNPVAPEFIPEALVDAAGNNDVAVITFQRQSGEGRDRLAADFDLDADDRDLLVKVADAFHKAGKKVVVVLNVGGAIETASWKDIPDAILLPWQCGQEIGHSIADMLAGKTAPSGHLPMTFPIRLTDHASTANFPLDSPDIGGWGDNHTDRKNIDYTEYEEGIYVGYRWFDRQGMEVSYPFGYGLTYTTFAFDGLQLALQKGEKPADDVVEVTVNVKNIGSAAGKQTAQVYVKAPKGSIMDKPEQELKGFAKTRLLKPGESQLLTIRISAKDLASFNERKSAWVVDAGTYTFRVGDSSRNILCEGTLKMRKQQETVSNSL